jgi:vitamin B12 transporter
VAPGQRVEAGVETRRQSVSSTTDYTVSSRNVSSVYAGYTGEFGAHSLQANVRGEHYSDFGSATTYLAGYGYRLASAWRLSAAASSAFRAPNFNELYYPLFGTPTLQPERARSVEAGVQYAQGLQLAKLVVFQTRIRDLIDGFPLANVSRAEITGAELSYRGQVLGADVTASFTAQNPEDRSNGSQQLLRRARDFASVSVQKSVGAWRLGGEVRGAGTRYDDNIVAFPTVRDTLGGYTVVNLMARYQLTQTLALQARLENAFNRDYQLADGYNTPPRTWFVGISYQP